MQRLGRGKTSDPSLSIPYIMGYNILWVLTDKLAKAFSGVTVRLGSMGSLFIRHKVDIKAPVKA